MKWMSRAAVGGCWVVFAFVLSLGWMSTPSVRAAGKLPGTGTLSGTVDAPKPFKAAEVYIKSLDRRMTYMVYTSGGKYRAVALLPGTYEIAVEWKGMISIPQRVTVKADADTAVPKVTLRDGPPPLDGQVVSYDEVYPLGPERTIAERTCIRCHGAGFIPSHKWGEREWNAAINFMSGKPYEKGVVALGTHLTVPGMIKPEMLSDQDRAIYVPWLVKNFGPDSKPRRIKFDVDMPVDEAMLGKAMYVEYGPPPEDPPGQMGKSPEFSKEKMTPLAAKYPGQINFVVGRRIPMDVQFDPTGNVWSVDRGVPNRLIKIDPRTGVWKDFVVPNPVSGAHDLLVDREGMAWVPEHHGLDATQEKNLTMFNTKTEKWDLRTPLDPDKVLRMAEKFGLSLVEDPKGNIYVGWLMGGAVSFWNRDAKKMFAFPLPDQSRNVYGIAADGLGNVWAALYEAGKIAKLDGKTHLWTEYTPPTQPAQIRRLNTDAQNNVWFGIYALGKRPGKLVKLDIKTGKMTEWTFPYDNAEPYHTAVYGNDIWMIDSGGQYGNQTGALVKFNTVDQKFTQYPKKGGGIRIQITKDGAVWYSHPGVLYPDMDKIASLAAYPPS